jgi:hypothetical protein
MLSSRRVQKPEYLTGRAPPVLYFQTGVMFALAVPRRAVRTFKLAFIGSVALALSGPSALVTRRYLGSRLVAPLNEQQGLDRWD